jgi:hypothetical protein
MRLLPVLLGVAVVTLWTMRSHAVQPDPLFDVAAGDDLHTFVSEEAGIGRTDNTCTVSEPVADRPPDDPYASSFATPNGTWYANQDRSLWAWWWGKRSAGDYKVLWVRPTGAQLQIIGRRIDGDAPPLCPHPRRVPSHFSSDYHRNSGRGMLAGRRNGRGRAVDICRPDSVTEMTACGFRP